MKTEISAAQIEKYQRDGFLAVEGFLNAEELRLWQQVTDEAVQQRLRDSGTQTNQASPEDFYAQVFTQCMRLAESHPGMRELIWSSEIARMAATLAGIDGIRVWHDQALYKPPYGNPTSYHLDNPYWSFSSPNSISIWIALDDATLENGCMWYIPSSHKTARYDNAGIGPNMSALLKIYPEWKAIAPVPAPVKAGTAVFHNGLTAHGAGANMTNRPRRAMTCAYMPEGSTFNGVRNVLSEADFNSLKIGDVLKNDKQNPLVWSKNR